MISRFKRKFSFLLIFCARTLTNVGFKPFTISLTGMIFAVISSYFYYYSANSGVIRILALLTLLTSGFLDALDGTAARLCSQVTKLGGILDSIMDRIGELFIYSSIMLSGLTSEAIGIWAITSSIMVSYIRSRSEVEGVRMSEGIGIVERPERILILATATVFNQIEIGMVIIAIFSSVTFIQRVIHVYKTFNP